MKNKRIIWIFVLTVVVLTAIAMALVLRSRKNEETAVTPTTSLEQKEGKAEVVYEEDEKENEVTAHRNISEDTIKTNVVRKFKDDKVINSYVVGRWQNTNNKDWYCVFYGEVDDEGMCWGKEWDESENVNEEDLAFHKNGWFQWRIQEGVLHKFAVMDMSSSVIHKSYKVMEMKDGMLVIEDENYATTKYSFTRVDD